MFFNNADFVSDISSWDVSGVESMDLMFYGTHSLRQAHGGCLYAKIITSMMAQNDAVCTPGVHDEAYGDAYINEEYGSENWRNCNFDAPKCLEPVLHGAPRVVAIIAIALFIVFMLVVNILRTTRSNSAYPTNHERNRLYSIDHL